MLIIFFLQTCFFFQKKGTNLFLKKEIYPHPGIGMGLTFMSVARSPSVMNLNTRYTGIQSKYFFFFLNPTLFDDLFSPLRAS